MRILIADNNVELCRVLQQFLSTHEEFDVVGLAHDGEQALEKIQDLEPDVILLDITMPYLDGLGVLESLK
ncbi:MAG: response regulator, partial [Bacillota bacterium]|nr:response regulator [Bacillota bacterium]